MGINPLKFNNFIYSKNSHFKYFQDQGIDIAVFGKNIIPEESDVRIYQCMLVYAYITQNLKEGSQILEISNTDTPVFKALLLKGYVCRKLNFNIKNPDSEDNLPAEINWVLKNEKDQIITEDDYESSDFIYSISEFDNFPETTDLFDAVYNKLRNSLKPMAYSLICFVGSVNEDKLIWNNKFLNFLSGKNINFNISDQNNLIVNDKDLFFISESYYKKYWKLSIDMKYKDLGKMHSVSILQKFNNPFLINYFQDFTYSKKSHFDLFDLTGYTEKLYGKVLKDSDRNIQIFKELLTYSLISINFDSNSKVLAIGEISENLEKALSEKYEFYKLCNPEILSEKTITSSNAASAEIIDKNGSPIRFFPLKYFDIIFSISEFSNLKDDLFIFTKIVTNIRTLKKDFGYVLLSFSKLFFNGVAYKSSFIYFLFNYVQKVNNFDKHYLMLKDSNLYSEFKKDYNLNSKNTSVPVTTIGYSILWKTIPQIPIISSVRPGDSLKKRPAYIFHHIMKSGGSSVVLALYKWFKIIFDHTEDPNGIYRDINEYVNYKINLENVYSDSCIVAHFQFNGLLLSQRYPEAIIRNKEFRLFTFVRDPLELVISLYYYSKSSINTTLEKYLNEKKNYLANLFPCNDLNYKEVLDRYFFIGIVERMQESFDKLAELAGNEKVTLPFVNKSDKDEQISKLSEEFIRKYKEKNELDYRIYNYCIEKFSKW